MSVKFSERETTWMESTEEDFKRFLEALQKRLNMKSFSRPSTLPMLQVLSQDIFLRGVASCSAYPSLAFRLRILILPRLRTSLLWEWDLERYPAYDTAPFSPLGLLRHFGKELGYVVYGPEERALIAKSVEARVWKLGCANDLMALLREYDRVAKFYTGQTPIFDLD